jgi:hypothetical protein
LKVGEQWWCRTDACNALQRRYAIGAKARGGKKDAWRWLWLPLPAQVAVELVKARYVLSGGAAGPGKSTGGRFRRYRRAMRIQGYEGLIIRKTFPELEKTHLRRMAREAELFKAHGIPCEFVESKRLMRFPKTDAIIECGHMEDADAVAKYLSTEYDDIMVDEGSQIDPQPLLELSTRARTSKPQVIAQGGARFEVVTNPGGPAHQMLLDLFIDKSPDFDAYPALAALYNPADWVYVPAKLDDNPYIDPSYVASLAVLPKWRYDQLRHGDWRVFSGQFFSEWDERVHVVDLVIPSGVEWFCSMDWGYTAPGCVLWWACLPDGHYHIAHEWKFQRESVETVAAGIWQRNKQLGVGRLRYIVADPAIWAKTGHGRGESVAETMLRFGLPMRKGDNDRVNGWMRLRALLRTDAEGQPWLTVSPDCRYGRRTMPGMQSDDKNPEDIDTNGDDHYCDAKRYGAMSRPSPTIVRANEKKLHPWLADALSASSSRSVLGSANVRSARG